MKKRVILLIIPVIFLVAQTASAYWIWTPKSGKWTNPKTAVKVKPGQQLESARALFEAKRYNDARREFLRLINAYPKSAEAADSQYYIGRIDEAIGRPYQAFQSYQKMIDKYPFCERIQEAVEREYKIADDFMSGKAGKGRGLSLPVENPCVEIFSKVVENSNYGPLADKAQYKLGLVLKGLGRYYEAEEAFSKLLKGYPDSEWVDAAKFQIAACRAAVSRGADYDQGATRDAAERFQEFVNLHPDAVLTAEAQKNIAVLQDKEARSNYNSGRFYERQNEFKSAEIYYNDVVNNYPETVWAAKSLERLQVLARRGK